MTTAIGIVRRTRQLRQSGPIFAFIKSTYVGPGDVVSGATAWWGLRAYSASVAGSKAINLRRDSDNSTQDFNTLGNNGSLDTASITTFKGGANLFCTKLFDQTRNGNDLTQTTAANQPKFILSGLGSLPILQGVHASNLFCNIVWPGSTINAPFSLSAVAERTGDTGNYGGILVFNGVNWGLFFQAAVSNSIILFGNGASFNATASDNSWHAIQSLVNNTTSSQIVVDGTTTTGNAGTTTTVPNGQSVSVIADTSGGGDALTGNWVEGGIWPSDISGSFTNLNSNQRNYWGF